MEANFLNYVLVYLGINLIFFLPVLCYYFLPFFKAYRRLKGGDWYYYIEGYEINEKTGKRNNFYAWSQKKPKEDLIIKEEHY